ncbi:MAG: M1 family metallopeptidase, partial [Saprospiraceae bacterium]|nr:M1 family metallopeptidase [Saprospiraceae bacterium]
MKYLCKKYVVVFILLFSCHQLFAQNYFQQKVDFEIKAKLDTISKLLVADCKIIYTNNSSETLEKIYLHLWWNALSDKKSPYASQKLERSSYDFHFSKSTRMGGYRKLLIAQNNKLLETSIYNYQGKTTPDILVIHLKEPCAPGKKVVIDVEYELEIPYRFSRFGYQDNVYNFTQWYPKPAVYDKNGWHPMPYLDLGEFYYDFGDYKVEIDIPVGLEMASTGVVSNTRLKDDRKSITINASNVTDFAFFISPDFIKEERNIEIDKRTIQLSVYKRKGNQQWDNALDYLERATRFYDDQVGPYPYPQVSIVDGSDNSSGGMEYPMITIIDHMEEEQVLDHLIAHEIGHNWFYAVLSNNERKHAWLDEGLNTYFEEKYNDKFYSDPVYDDLLPPMFVSENSEHDLMALLLIHLQRINRDLPVNTPSQDMDLFNYGAMSYQKMAWSLEYLSSYLGEELFNDCIKSYYNKWKFKHPDPGSIQSVFESVSDKELHWFFEDLLNTTQRFDYVLSPVKKLEQSIKLEVRQKGDLNIPYHISIYDRKDSLIVNHWMKGMDLGESVDLQLDIHPDVIDRISINGAVPFLDINRKNNHYFYNNTLLHRNKSRFNFLFKTTDSRYNSINWFPSVMGNGYDGLMTGLQLTNDIFPSGSFRYYLNLAYGYKSQLPVGIFSLRKDFYPGGKKIRKWQLGIHGKQFSYNEYLDLNLKYRKLVPHIKLFFSNGMRKNQSLEYKFHWLDTEYLEFDEFDITSIRNESSLVHQLNFNADWHKRLSQNQVKLGLEYQEYETIIDQEHYLK